MLWCQENVDLKIHSHATNEFWTEELNCKNLNNFWKQHIFNFVHTDLVYWILAHFHQKLNLVYHKHLKY